MGIRIVGRIGVLALLGACGGLPWAREGLVVIDGSSSVFPVVEAAAAAHGEGGPIPLAIAISGTGGGFQRLCNGEVDLVGASRRISADEARLCASRGVTPVDVPIAWDGVTVLVNPDNDAVRCLTLDELRRIWEPGSPVSSWRDVRSDLPAEDLVLYGPGADSGTFDWFTAVVTGESGASRSDFRFSEDDHLILQGVSGDRYALGYVAHAYAIGQEGEVRPVAIDGGQGCVLPTEATIGTARYPLSRILYVYVSQASLSRVEVGAFLSRLLRRAPELAPSLGYVPLDPRRYEEGLARVGRDAGA